MDEKRQSGASGAVASGVISDLVEHFKLEAKVFPDHVIHTEFHSDRTQGVRKSKVQKKWYRQRNIGRGGFGAVWLEEFHDEAGGLSTRAVKEVDKRYMEAVKVDYKRELLALSKLSKHKEAFPEFFGWFETNSVVFLAMEYFQYGDLENHIRTGISESDARQISSQLLDGLSIMHREGFTHRDLKPANIFVVSTSPEWWVKIGDFGISKRVQQNLTALRTQIGTPAFQAPEVRGLLFDLPHTSIYTSSVDIWSLGCVIYQILCQKVPFPDADTLSSFTRGKYPFPARDLYSKSISPEGVAFVESLIVSDPSRRLTAAAAAKLPWLEIRSQPQSILSPNAIQNLASAVSRTHLNASISLDSSVRTVADSSQLSKFAIPSGSSPAKRKPVGVPSSTNLATNSEPSIMTARTLYLKAEEMARQSAMFSQAGQIRTPTPGLITQSTQNSNNWTVLHVAAQSGQEEIVRMLLKQGNVDINAPGGPHGSTPLYQAAHTNHANIVSMLLDNGADPEKAHTTDGYTPLLIAAERNRRAAFDVLLEKGANDKAQARAGFTAVHLAAQNGHYAILEILLNRIPKPDVNARAGKYGATPLYQAAAHGHYEATVLLHDHGADLERANIHDGYNPLLIASERGQRAAALALLARGANPNVKSVQNWTPLHSASQNGHALIAKVLLDMGADVNARGGSHGQTPLYQAALNGHNEVVVLLLQHGADPRIKNVTDQFTPVMIAAQAGHATTVEILISHHNGGLGP